MTPELVEALGAHKAGLLGVIRADSGGAPFRLNGKVPLKPWPKDGIIVAHDADAALAERLGESGACQEFLQAISLAAPGVDGEPDEEGALRLLMGWVSVADATELTPLQYVVGAAWALELLVNMTAPLDRDARATAVDSRQHRAHRSLDPNRFYALGWRQELAARRRELKARATPGSSNAPPAMTVRRAKGLLAKGSGDLRFTTDETIEAAGEARRG